MAIFQTDRFQGLAEQINLLPVEPNRRGGKFRMITSGIGYPIHFHEIQTEQLCRNIG